MPYIKTTANIAISKDQRDAIKTQLGKDISLLGKSESWLMVDFQENAPLYFKGGQEPAALVGVDLYGGASGTAYGKMTEAITRLLSERLSITPDRIFVKYQEHKIWGWNGSNF